MTRHLAPARSAVRAGHPLRGVLIALALPLAATALLGASQGRPPAPSASAPALAPCPAQVAQDLGISWSFAEGAAEELEAFHFGVIACERERGQWVCWHEENDLSPSGLERICGQPSHLNEVLASEVRIWAVDIHPIFPQCMEGDSCWDCVMMGNLTCGIPASSGKATASSARPLALVG